MRREQGFTVAELITIIVIIGVLAGMALPVAKFGLRRQREIDLRIRIRQITNAIDRYHDLRVKGMIKNPTNVTQGEYPKDLQELANGVELLDGRTVKFLRERDLIDPMTGNSDWATRSTSDAIDSDFSDNNNVFDVHSSSTALALDGKTRYNEW